MLNTSEVLFVICQVWTYDALAFQFIFQSFNDFVCHYAFSSYATRKSKQCSH